MSGSKALITVERKGFGRTLSLKLGMWAPFEGATQGYFIGQ